MNFLVIQTAFIGDVILGTAVVEKLHAFYPDASIDVLVQKSNTALFDGHPFIRHVIAFDKKQRRLSSLSKIIRSVRQQKYDVVINMHRFFSSGLITSLSGAKQKIGFDKNPLSWTYTQRVSHEISKTGEMHEVQRDLLLISSLTDTDLSFRPRLYPPKEAYDKVRRTERYVCIAPASVWFTKQWPQEKWVDLIHRLDDQFAVLLLGSPQDRTLCESIAASVGTKRVEVLAGTLTLLESAALMEGARMNYVNDSAPMHLASAVNAPVTAIFCSTVPGFGFGPLSDVSFIAETAENLKCRPCGLHGHRACPMGHFKCSEIEMVNLLGGL